MSSTLANANCATMQNLAQESANSMAGRDHMNHYRFNSHASQKGSLAENAAIAKSKADAIAQWWGSPGHASNMRLNACKSVASAVSRSGRRYWAMVIGNSYEQRKASLQRKRDDHRKTFDCVLLGYVTNAQRRAVGSDPADG